MSKNTTALVAAAALGILAGTACRGSQPPPATASSEPTSEKAGCGTHEPGKCASVRTKPAASSDQPLRVARTETISPGKAIEVNLSYATAIATKATFKASAPLEWNVHSHRAGGMVEHQKGFSATGEIAFQPPATGVYSFMWKNDGSTPVTIEVAMSAERDVAELPP